MATVTKPMALDESINTTESTSRNIADVLAQELSGIASAITGGDDKANKTDIATVEPTNTASRAYSVGELVYVNGNLYKVKTAISQGASFTVGTNIEPTNVSDAFTNILDTYTLTSENNGSIEFQKKNDVVTAIISVLKTATNGEIVAFGTLPSSYRPTRQIMVAPRDMNNLSGAVYIVIRSTGEVTMENYGYSTAGTIMNNSNCYLCTYLV